MRRLLFAATAAALAGPALAQTARPNTQIDGTAPASNMGGIAAYDGTTVAYFKNNNGNAIEVSASTNCGFTWEAPVRIDGDVGNAFKFTGWSNGKPTIWASGDHVYVTWSDDRNGDSEIYFKRSLDGGATWEGEQLLDKGLAPVGANDVKDWAMSVTRAADPNDDSIWVLMAPENDAAGGDEDVYATVSVDGGATWAPTVPVSDDNGTGLGDVDEIAICSYGTNAYAAWIDDRNGKDDLFYKRLGYTSLSGWAFGPEQELSAYPGTSGAAGDVDSGGQDPAITIDSNGSKVVLGWQEENELVSANELGHIRVSNDDGLSFGPAIVVGGYDVATDDVDSFTAFLSGSNVVCVWDDDRGGSDQVFTATSTDDGASFTEVQHTTAGGGFVRVAKGGDEVGLFWSGGAFPNLTEGVYSDDNGGTWSSRITVSTTTGDADFAEAAYDPSNGNFAVAWESDDLGVDNIYVGGLSYGAASVSNRSAAGNPDIYTSNAPVLGANWEVEVDMTSEPGYANAIVAVYTSPTSLATATHGVLLVNGVKLLTTSILPGPVATLSAAIPYEPCLVGQSAYSQAAIFGGSPYLLTNAQDFTVGGF